MDDLHRIGRQTERAVLARAVADTAKTGFSSTATERSSSRNMVNVEFPWIGSVYSQQISEVAALVHMPIDAWLPPWQEFARNFVPVIV